MYDCFQRTVHQVQCDQRALLPGRGRTHMIILDCDSILRLSALCLSNLRLSAVSQAASFFPFTQVQTLSRWRGRYGLQTGNVCSGILGTSGRLLRAGPVEN